jgi:hypothetical protein
MEIFLGNQEREETVLGPAEGVGKTNRENERSGTVDAGYESHKLK